MLIKVLLFFCYCFSSKNILLSIAPFSLGQAIRINFENKRKHSDSTNEGRKKNKGFDFEKKSKKSIQSNKKKPSQCDVCEKSFARRDILNNHRRTHTGEKPYKCTLCEKSFAQQPGLIKHKRTHTGEKTYQCDVCEKSFARGDALIKHKRTHTGEKPYQCIFCSKKFTTNSNRADHQKTHTRKKKPPVKQPYQCEFCPTRFTRKNNYERHKKKQHDNKKPDIPQEDTQAGQEFNSTIMETQSELDWNNIEEGLDPSDEGELSPSDQGQFFPFELELDWNNIEEGLDPSDEGELSPSDQGQFFPFALSDNNKPDIPQEETQAGQESNSTMMETQSKVALNDIREWFDSSYQGTLFPFALSDNNKPDIPQEETQAGQEFNSTRMEVPSELAWNNIEEWSDPSEIGRQA